MTEAKNESLLAVLYKQEGVSDTYVDFKVALEEVSEKYKKLFEPLPVVFPEKDIINSKFEAGMSLITFVPVSISLKTLTNTFRETVAAFQAHKVCSSGTSTWVKEKMDSRFLKGITEAVISFDFDVLKDLAEPTPFDVPTLLLVCRELVKPFFHALSGKAAGAIEPLKWEEGYCPICGGAPSFSRFSKEKEGKRCLWCGTCDMEWRFRRVCCPYCKNSDHNTLKFLTADFREELRVDVCDKCKGYVKAIDEKKIEKEEPAVYLKEDTASMYLDILAEEKGYTKGLPSFQDAQITFLDDFNG